MGSKQDSTIMQIYEMAGEIQGANGVGCFPKAQGYNCPTDVPEGTTAQPMPVIQDQSGDLLCGLVCAGPATGNCASGATCVSLGQASLCLYSQPTLSTIDN